MSGRTRTTWCFLPAPPARDGGRSRSTTPIGGLAHTGLRVASPGAGRRPDRSTTGDVGDVVVPALRRRSGSTSRGRRRRARRPVDVFAGPDRLRLPPGGADHVAPAARRPVRAALRRSRHGGTPRSGTCAPRRAGRAARRRAGSREVRTSAPPASRGRLDDRLRGDHAGRNWCPTRRTSTTRTRSGGSPSSRRSTTSRCGGGPRPARGYQRVYGTENDRSTCSPRSAPVTSSWSRTAGTARRWRLPATTCTTSTSWPAPASAPGGSATTRPTPGCGRPGRTQGRPTAAASAATPQG